MQAPGGVSARCPYCQASALQVYLRPLPSSPAECEAEEGAATADGACEAAADGDAPPAAAVPPARPPSSGCSSNTARAASTASSGLSMGSLEFDNEAGVSVTAFLAPAPAAAAREAVRQHQEALRSGCIPGAADGSCGSGLVPVTLSLECDLRLLAEAAAEASRAQGPAIVAMVRRADQPSGSGSGEAASGEVSSSGESCGSGRSSSGSEPGGGSRASDTRPPAVGEQPDTPATELAAQPDTEPSLPAEGGPAVLQLPDGSQQLVLLRSAQQVAEEEAAAAAAARARDEAAAGAGAAAAATYQPPATAEDERMRSAIAQADAALLQHQPPVPSRQPGDDWLERMRQADAALQAAVARRDAERFGSGGSGDGGSGSD